MDTHDLYHALAGLLIVLGRELNRDQALRIQQESSLLAHDLEQAGEAGRAVLTLGLSDALTAHCMQPNSGTTH